MVSAPAQAPPVGIVVVNWQRPEATRACLAAVAELDYPRRSLVLVDNGCRDFDAAGLEALAPGGRYLHSDTNRGFAGGANLGMRAALADGADWVWFLNNDARPAPDALTAAIATALGSPPADVVGAKILQQAAPDRLDSVGLDVDLDGGRVRLMGHDEVDRGQYDRRTDPLAVTGCAMLVSRLACEYLAGFNEAFFAYHEDADLCLRARRVGLRVAFAPAARVFHDRLPAQRGRQSPTSLYYATRNHLLLLQLHSPAPAWRRRVQERRVIAASLAYALRADPAAVPARLAAVRAGIRDFRANRLGAGAPP